MLHRFVFQIMVSYKLYTIRYMLNTVSPELIFNFYADDTAVISSIYTSIPSPLRQDQASIIDNINDELSNKDFWLAHC